MNPAETFVPKWADSALTKPLPVDAAELKLLRKFYSQWVHYHTIPTKRKDLQREAGDALILTHEALMTLNANRQ